MFWKRKAQDREPDEAISGAGSGKLAPVRIFTADSTVDGWVDLAGQRLSDVLNGEELLSVSRMLDPTERDWHAYERDHLLLVVPPPLIADQRLRRHRVKRRILAKTGGVHRSWLGAHDCWHRTGSVPRPESPALPADHRCMDHHLPPA